MAICACGYIHSHIEHACQAGAVKPGTRPKVPGPRCIGCNTLHGHIPHDCALRDAKLKELATRPKFVEEPATEAIALAQFAQGWRPPNMCKDCPKLSRPCKACWVRAGYKEEHYSEL